MGLLHFAPCPFDLHGEHFAGFQSVVLGLHLVDAGLFQGMSPPHQSEMGMDTCAKTIPSSTSLSVTL